jgi:hypothetical protein
MNAEATDGGRAGGNFTPELRHRQFSLVCRCGTELTWHIEAADPECDGSVSVEDGYLVVDYEDFADPWGMRDYYHEGLYCSGCREFLDIGISPDERIAEYLEGLAEAGVQLQPSGGHS